MASRHAMAVGMHFQSPTILLFLIQSATFTGLRACIFFFDDTLRDGNRATGVFFKCVVRLLDTQVEDDVVPTWRCHATCRLLCSGQPWFVGFSQCGRWLGRRHPGVAGSESQYRVTAICCLGLTVDTFFFKKNAQPIPADTFKYPSKT